MKRSHGEDPHSRGNRAPRTKVQWDEANLEENDKVKEELRPRQCDEPKTPYHGPLDTDEELSLEEAEMSPLALDEEDEVTQRRSSVPSGGNHSVPLQDVVDALPQPNGEHYIDRPRHRSNSTDSTGSSGETAKRQKFEEHRKAHYKMREALRRLQCLPCGLDGLSCFYDICMLHGHDLQGALHHPQGLSDLCGSLKEQGKQLAASDDLELTDEADSRHQGSNNNNKANGTL